MPGHVGRQGGDVVAAQAREGDGGEGADADRGGEDAEILDDRVERVAAVAGEVHLVDGKDQMADAEQVAEIGVPPGLDEDALAGVDEQDGEVGGGRAGDHVAGVLLVAGRVGDDELALFGGEEAVGDVDGDALLALGGEAVDEQREVDGAALGAGAAAVGLEVGDLVLEDRPWSRTAGGRSGWICRRRRSRRSGSAAASCSGAA